MTKIEVPSRRFSRITVWASIAQVSAALWLGSLFHMLLSVATLFRVFPKAVSDIAVESAPALFHVTEQAILVLALIALLGTFAWHRIVCCRRLLWAIDLLLIASALAVVQAFFISAKMDTLRLANEGGGEMFRRLHALSSGEYLLQTLLVAGAICILPHARRPDGHGILARNKL